MTFIQLKYYQLLLSVTLVMFYISLAMVNRWIRRVPISVHFFTFKGNLLSRWLLRYRRFHVLNWFVQSIRNRLNIVDVIFARMLCKRKKISSLHHSLDMNWKLSFLGLYCISLYLWVHCNFVIECSVRNNFILLRLESHHCRLSFDEEDISFLVVCVLKISDKKKKKVCSDSHVM